MIQLFEKNNMKKYILIIIFIHFVSCQQNEIDPKEYFQQVVNIKANQLNADTYKLSSFGRMIIICILLIYQRLHLHGSKKAF